MKNRIILLATALLCALAICFSAVPALSVFAEENAESTPAESTPAESTLDESNEAESETEAPLELFDVALNQYAEATFSIEGSNWGVQGLLAGLKSDAKLANNDPAGWHHDMSGTISAMHAPVITIYLDSVYTIYTIDLYPVNAYNDAYVSVMPQEFTIELSADGGRTWQTVATETGVVSQVAR